MEYPMSHMHFHGTHTWSLWANVYIKVPGMIFHGIQQKSTAFTFLYHAIENNSGQNNQCDTLMAHDGEVGCNTIKYTMVFL